MMSKSNEMVNFQQPESEIILIDLTPNLHSLFFVGSIFFYGKPMFFSSPKKTRPYFSGGGTLAGVPRLTCHSSKSNHSPPKHTPLRNKGSIRSR